MRRSDSWWAGVSLFVSSSERKSLTRSSSLPKHKGMCDMSDNQSAMITIPAGHFEYQARHRFREGGFVLYDEGPRTLDMLGFSMDRYEVTNADFRRFLTQSGYQPADRHNFLRHWRDGYPEALADHPVTWVSLED